jgi:hypothetical protein
MCRDVANTLRGCSCVHTSQTQPTRIGLDKRPGWATRVRGMLDEGIVLVAVFGTVEIVVEIVAVLD